MIRLFNIGSYKLRVIAELSRKKERNKRKAFTFHDILESTLRFNLPLHNATLSDEVEKLYWLKILIDVILHNFHKIIQSFP